MPKKARISNQLRVEMTLAEMDRLVAVWVASPDGQKKLAAAARAAEAAADQVMSDAKVDPEQLRRAVTL
jgi:hypothetical protein